MMGGDETKRWAHLTIWLLAIALLLPTGKVSAEVATIQPKTTGITPGALKELILEMANDAGDEQHLMPLRYCPPFSEAARRHARDMIEGGYFEHIDRNDLTVTGPSVRPASDTSG